MRSWRQDGRVKGLKLTFSSQNTKIKTTWAKTSTKKTGTYQKQYFISKENEDGMGDLPGGPVLKA